MKPKDPQAILDALTIAAARAEGIPLPRMFSRRKDYPTARARMAVCYVAHKVVGIRNRAIAAHLGRAYDSIRYNSAQFRDRIKVEPRARILVETLVREVLT